MYNRLVEPQYRSITEEMSLSNFNRWQISNANKLGVEVELDKKLTMNYRQIDEMFGNKIHVKDVNPLSADDNSTMGYAFYEWLAEASAEHENKCEGLMYAARHFSWQYPQLKMHFHEVLETTPDPDDEYFLDNVEFVIEFLS